MELDRAQGFDFRADTGEQTLPFGQQEQAKRANNGDSQASGEMAPFAIIQHDPIGRDF